MTWLDRILATPLIGLEFAPWAASSQDAMHSVQPLVEKWISSEKTVTVDTKDVFTLHVEAGAFDYDVTHSQVNTAFQYRFQLVNPPGENPQLRYNDELRPYSTLLSETSENSKVFLGHVLRGKARVLRRVGVMATCRVAFDAAPPGLIAFVEHLLRPWNAKAEKVTARIMARLDGTSAYHDRCHHTIDLDEVDRAGDVRVTLDWQRVFESPQSLRPDDISKDMNTWTEAAVAYFEKFGAGDLDYGDV